MPITINGTGSITGISAGGLPDGVIATDDIAAAAVTPAKLSQPFTSGTAVASTSGTSIDFTGIPSWAKRITVMFSGVSTNGSSLLQIQLGDSGGVETTGYASAASYGPSSGQFTTSTAGFILQATNQGSSASLSQGVFVITKLTGFEYVGSGTNYSGGVSAACAGSKTLSDTLTQVRITTVNGTDTFDAGTINILYE